nr:MAG TPA: hypothetical protein [Caudoviricetes sp.]
MVLAGADFLCVRLSVSGTGFFSFLQQKKTIPCSKHTTYT